MKILITGATGLIGRALCHVLQDHNLVALSRDAKKARSCLPANTTVISSLESVDFNTLDAIINLAGEPIAERRWTQSQKQRIYSSRVTLTRTISLKIKAATRKPEVMISGSAIGYYGRQPSNLLIDESFGDFHDEFSHQLCRDWENATHTIDPSTRVCILRTGIVLSKQGGAMAKLKPQFQFGLGGKISDGEHIMSWIHIDDMVNAIVFLLTNENCSGVYNLTAPNPVNNLAFSQTLAATLARPCWFTTPAWLLKLLFGEMADLLIFGQAVIPLRLQQAGFQFRYPTLDTALAQLYGA
ncbi:TIGR01777 family oxidoreductase [Pseudoalteromonas fenneropenaei]|uniref:TIGR01777 family oxidoreductase n=1 Tax=Pseudoalteromonas fenneropenaei TaxID=1737459 RepID=A0ABV7CPU2_9GAMM